MRFAWFAVLCGVSVGGLAEAQSTARPEPLGVRERRGERLPASFGQAMVAATDEGLVALVFDDRLGGTWDLAREPRSSREFYLPDEVLQWVNGLNTLTTWLGTGRTSAPPSFVLGGDGGVVITAGGNTDRLNGIAVSVNRCRQSVAGDLADAAALTAASSAFRRAALEARAIARRKVPDDAVWYPHAIACAAVPVGNNPAAPWPVAVSDLRPHQELVQFVVNATGAIEPGSERFLPSADARFIASIRSVLPAWRFTPARRMALPVRQLVTTNVSFAPPIVLDARGTTCGEGAPETVLSEITPEKALAGGMPGESTCVRLFTAPMSRDMVSVLPQGDSLVRLSTHTYFGSPQVTMPATRLRQFLDTVASQLGTLPTSTTRERTEESEFAPNGPVIGSPVSRGLNMWLSSTGWIRAGYWCGRDGMGQVRLLEVAPQEFGTFQRVATAALDRVPLQRKWSRDNRPFVEHELTCDVRRWGNYLSPSLHGRGDRQTSTEAVVSLVVDSAGRAEAGSIEVMPGPDSVVQALVTSTVKDWAFLPAVAGDRHVRVRTHLSVVVRPADADAVILASFAPATEDTVQRTIFFDRARQPRRDPPVIARGRARDALSIIKPYVDSARRTWPEARNRFLLGLPILSELVVTVMGGDNLGNSDFAFVRVDRVLDGMIYGRILSHVSTSVNWLDGDVFVLPESELLDWTIYHQDARDEGNFIGRFLGTSRVSR